MTTTSSKRLTRRFTADEVLQMVEHGVLGEDEPVELLDGELVIVSPQGPRHSNLCDVIRQLLEERYGAGFRYRVASPLESGSESLPEPDIAVVRGGPRDFMDRHPGADEAVLLVEIAVTSLSLDLSKAEIYAAAGAPVYWLLDVNARRLLVHGDPRPDGRYATIHVLSDQDNVELPALATSLPVASLLP